MACTAVVPVMRWCSSTLYMTWPRFFPVTMSHSKCSGWAWYNPCPTEEDEEDDDMRGVEFTEKKCDHEDNVFV
jgi:hypothetical protein